MSSVLPLDTNIKAADDNGYSTQTDIGLLGAVIYEIVTGERYLPLEACRATWPLRTTLLANKVSGLARSLRNVGQKVHFRIQIACQRHSIPSAWTIGLPNEMRYSTAASHGLLFTASIQPIPQLGVIMPQQVFEDRPNFQPTEQSNSMLSYLSIVQHLRTIGKLIRGWPVFVIKIAMFINFDHTAIETKAKPVEANMKDLCSEYELN
ncbi:conserved hypothetical protein [Histoplasma capsulatum G186AR]|uniref:Protein kinase domain-containing protein n=1 Tax=Ajellomyces capsulatus (strain G186AR / H82 / ATCC MYA-2454 / RMSCC 2432) TaxID=447093 RepID=C0NWH2_AJECG|nr:uncharacterized protein HCBG_07502 [Histoplasma capsulatum G186AR]EEH04277.1 conserved hypothetical protein [Histoplasma capsulatum G186AR]